MAIRKRVGIIVVLPSALFNIVNKMTAKFLRQIKSKCWLNGAANDLCQKFLSHPFSLRIVSETLEAKILQDADRLNALGAIGIARCFAVGASLARPLYDPEDMFCREYEPNDTPWTMDYFYRKLLRLPEILHMPHERWHGNGRLSCNNFSLS